MRKSFLLVPWLAIVAMPACQKIPECARIVAAVELACPVAPNSAECKEAQAMALQRCGVPPVVEPPPVEPPPVEPPPVEPPPVDPPPVEPPPVDPPPADTQCPKRLAEGAQVYINCKPYGNGVDCTYRVRGDAAFCKAIHPDCEGKGTCGDCHTEGWPKRVACELELAGGCPVFQWTNDAHPTWQSCLQVNDDESGMSCDHFGDPTDRDDPQTPNVFEGKPAECGIQRDGEGNPNAGFFMVPHTPGPAFPGYVRGCLPDHATCSGGVRIQK